MGGGPRFLVALRLYGLALAKEREGCVVSATLLAGSGGFRVG